MRKKYSQSDLKQKAREISNVIDGIIPSDIGTKTGAFLKELRNALAFQQKDLAELMGISASAISQAESRTHVNPDFVRRYVESMGIHLYEFQALQNAFSLMNAESMDDLFKDDFKTLLTERYTAATSAKGNIMELIHAVLLELTARELVSVLAYAEMVRESAFLQSDPLTERDLKMLEDLRFQLSEEEII